MAKTFIEAVQLTGEARQEEIIARLKEYSDDDLLDLYREANAWDGSFDFVEALDIEDLCSMHEDAYDIVRAVIYGNVNNVIDPVRFNAYGNLESVSEYDLKQEAQDCIDELTAWLMDDWYCVDSLDCEDEELFEAWDKIDDDEDYLEELLAELEEE